jgi:predicted PurR-regulated permease PerM
VAPIAFSMIIAILLNPLVNKLQKKGVKKVHRYCDVARTGIHYGGGHFIFHLFAGNEFWRQSASAKDKI